MNFEAESNTGLKYANFNQDFSCLALGTNQGFTIYNLNPFKKAYSRADDTPRDVVTMSYSSSLVCAVGSGESPSSSPRKLHIYNTQRDKLICTLNFVTPILNVLLNRSRLIIVMETKIHVHDVSNMKILYTIDTNPNPNGLCALSSSNTSILAYPKTADGGEVVLFDAINMEVIQVLNAHNNALTCLTFDQQGDLLATTSIRGTVIRVFACTPDSEEGSGSSAGAHGDGSVGWKLVQSFRRGTYPTRVYNINFSPDGSFLICSSETETVHIFKIAPPVQMSPDSGAIYAYVPTAVSEMWKPFRHFAFAKLPAAKLRSICSLAENNQTLYVVTSRGNCLLYNMDPVNGGECLLREEISINENPDLAESVMSQYL